MTRWSGSTAGRTAFSGTPAAPSIRPADTVGRDDHRAELQAPSRSKCRPVSSCLGTRVPAGLRRKGSGVHRVVAHGPSHRPSRRALDSTDDGPPLVAGSDRLLRGSDLSRRPAQPTGASAPPSKTEAAAEVQLAGRCHRRSLPGGAVPSSEGSIQQGTVGTPKSGRSARSWCDDDALAQQAGPARKQAPEVAAPQLSPRVLPSAI